MYQNNCRKANSMKRPVALLLVLLLIAPILLPLFTVKGQETRITISNAQEFIEVAKKARLDSWSKGKQIILQNDIDLSGETFMPIPIFSGTFDGAGYTISGVKLEEGGGGQGLFRYLEEGGIVKNLKVEGKINPTGSKEVIGGIVGENKGTLMKCTFVGEVTGTKQVGGLVGVNEASGKIIDCLVNATVYGQHQIGGVAGENRGTILRSTNKGNINTHVIEQDITFEKIVDEETKVTEISADITDIGGITGLNTGMIQNSNNGGTVGYKHVGYNIGGIAGRQSGYINACTNIGTIYGRKEVGGIIGQMEPYTLLTYSKSQLDTLRNELNTLESLLKSAMTNGKGSTDLISGQLSQVKTYVDTAQAHTESLIDQTGEIIDTNVGEVNRISVTIAEAIDRLVPVTEAFSDMAMSMEEAIAPVQKSMDYMVKLSNSMGRSITELENVSNQVGSALSELEDAVYYLKRGNSLIITAAETLANKDIEQAFAYLGDTRLSFERSGSALEGSLSKLQSSSSSFSKLLSNLEDSNEYGAKAIKSLRDALDEIEIAAGYFSDSLKGVEEVITYLSEQPEVTFTVGDNVYQETKESLYTSMHETSDALGELNVIINNQMNLAFDDLEKITDQFFVVLDVLLDITESVMSFEPSVDNYTEDISKIDTESQTEGKVANSTNKGFVQGDINVGGIAGAMAVEKSFDPEDDLEVKGDKSINFVFQTRAVLRSCRNIGEVEAKKDSAGGVVGLMQLGYVVDAVSEGKVASESGNYVGGIAGKSKSLIRSSYAKNFLSGGDYIGGIVGEGKDIIDCRALIEIEAGNDYIGAVAGKVQSGGQVRGNYYVADDLGAIDNISYAGKAEPLAYKDFITLEGMPKSFTELAVYFIVEDKLLEKVQVTYGEAFDKGMLPEVPYRENYYGKWEDFDKECMLFDVYVDAVYSSLVTTLESEQRLDQAMPIVLVEGLFNETDKLVVENLPQQKIENKSDDKVAIEEWHVVIPEDGNEVHRIRYLAPDSNKTLTLDVKEGENWKQQAYQRDGKYIYFDVATHEVTWRSTSVEGPNYIKEIIIGIAISMFIVGGSVFFHRRRKKRNREEGIELTD